MRAEARLRVFGQPFWLWALVTAAFLWAFAPVLQKLATVWYSNDDYSHGFLIIPTVLYLVYRKSVKSPTRMPESGPVTQMLWFAAVAFFWMLYLVGLISEFETLVYTSFLCALISALFFLFDQRILFQFSWEIMFLCFLIPLPASLYARLTIPLQLLTTQLSSHILSFFHFPVFREGNLIHLSAGVLQVVNVCSGLRSVISILCISYILAIFSFSSSKLRLILIVLSLPIAIIVNIIRILILAFDLEAGSSFFFTGIPHTLLGVFLFGLSVALVFAAQKVLTWVYVRD